MKPFFFVLWCVSILIFPVWVFAANVGPRIVTSVTPIHTLVSEITKGVVEPVGLVPPGSSPHNYQLRSSDLRLVSSADVVFWVDASLESFLPKILSAVPHVRAVGLLSSPHIHHLPLNRGSESLGAEHQGHSHSHHGESDARVDPHIWLDPRNAVALVEEITQVLEEEDPSHQKLYRANAVAFTKRLQYLEREIFSEIGSARAQSFLMFHDALQYFTHRFGLKSVASLVVNPSLPPGVHDIQRVRRYIEEHNVQCFFTEPGHRSRIADALVRETGVRHRTLDILGVYRDEGGNVPHSYDSLLRNISKALLSCATSRNSTK